MKDFLGVEINIGDYVAAGGAGNKSCEYGMILYKVLSVNPVKFVRLSVAYPKQQIVVSVRKVFVTNLNKYVKVVSPENICKLFEAGISNNLSKNEAELIAKWVHGADHQFPWGK